MQPYGFFVEFEARAGKEDDVEQLLGEAKLIVVAEPGTSAWFAFRLGPSSFRILDAFNSEDDRQSTSWEECARRSLPGPMNYFRAASDHAS